MYPVVFETTQFQQEPIRGSGFHLQRSPEKKSSCKQGLINSTIVYTSKSVHMIDTISSPKKTTGHQPYRIYQQSGLQNRGRRVNLSVLSVGGMVDRFPEMGRPSLQDEHYITFDCKGVTAPTYPKTYPKSLTMSKRKHLPTSADLIIHGQRASMMFDQGRILPGYGKPITQRGGFVISETTTAPQRQRSTNTVHETFISKLVKCHQNYPRSLTANKPIKSEGAATLSKNNVESAVGGVGGVDGIKLSGYSSCADVRPLAKEIKRTGCVSEDSISDLSDGIISAEKSLRSGSSVQQPQLVFIPTS